MPKVKAPSVFHCIACKKDCSFASIVIQRFQVITCFNCAKKLRDGDITLIIDRTKLK